MIEMINKKIKKEVEDKLFLYKYIDDEIKEIQDNTEIEKCRDINSWVKSKGKKSSIIETQAIAKIVAEEKIKNLLKWKSIINDVIEMYKKCDMEKFIYIKLRYFKRYNSTAIEYDMAISETTHWRIRQNIIYYIILFAVQSKLLKV